jgi:hypothetical protein
VAFDPQSAPKFGATAYTVSVSTRFGLQRFTGVNVGRRKGSIFGAATHLAIRIEHALDVTVQGLHDADPR